MSSKSSANKSRILKIVLVGDGGVGKSSLITRYVKNEFNVNCFHTIGVEFLKKDVSYQGVTYALQIWDTAGQELFKSLRTPFYRGSDACFLTYSVDDENSFKNLQTWKEEFLQYAKIGEDQSFPFVVLGNKVDIDPYERKVDLQTAVDYCDKQRILHFETSAKSSANVEAAFMKIVQTIAEFDRSNYLSSNTMKTSTINLQKMEKKSDSERACC
ncbi:DgyrCDS7734 [Dimorphilus gyrociliatus]|uniref:small monomeric GTPase n=1 Tax=Dimorphilus gyrociliatus TaxID=2664684 RepID=A0A7I8VS18_9ANNE|nr:DgyrCDS7734 [Dimorphilus gyrociliatus]